MATKNTKSKSNVSKSAGKSSFQFRWWMAVLAVGVIAVVGIAVLRFSHAGSAISYSAANFTKVPGFSQNNAQYVTVNAGKGNVAAYRLNNNGSLTFPLQLFTGNYRACAYGTPVPGVSGSYINLLVLKGGERFTNAGRYSSSTGAICVDFNTVGATAPVEFRVVNSGGGSNNADINGMSVEAR